MKSKDFSSILGRRSIKHVWSFMSSHQLVSSSGNYLLTLSGGIDSVFLLHLFKQFKLNGLIADFKAIHIHHNTRGTQDLEQQFVTKLCSDLKVELIVKKIDWSEDSKSNFEHMARLKRFAEFFKELSKDSLLVLGHHIDDSFEWSLLQKFKSGSLKSGIGIPVRNKKIVRPLMCLTKKQIQSLCKLESLNYIQDPTNDNNNFERNYLRNQVIPLIAQKHPKYLKNYVYRSSELARKLDLYINDYPGDFYSYKATKDSYVVLNYKLDNDFEGFRHEFRSIIHTLSNSARGSLNSQIDSLITAAKNQKNGPIKFSGGVQAYLDRNYILLTSDNLQRKVIEIYEDDMKYISLEKFRKKLYKKYKKKNPPSPLLVVVKRELYFGKDLVTRKKIGDFCSNSGIHRNLVFDSAMSLLTKWSTKKGLKNRQLKLKIIKLA